MTDYAPVDFAKSLDEIIDQMAEGHEGAKAALKHIASRLIEQRKPLLPTLFDLDDMRMRGEQIECAWMWCDDGRGDADIDEFIQACATRDEQVVNYVNTCVRDRTARCRGPQTVVSQVDQAVQSALNQNPTAQLEQADEGAAAVHAFFIALFARMQAQKTIVANHHINTGMEGVGMITFAIHLCEIKDSEGKTLWELPSEPPAEPSVQ